MGRSSFNLSDFNDKLNRKYEVLEMNAQRGAVDPEEEEKKRKFLSEENYWKDIRARTTALEVGKQTNSGALARQELSGKSAENVAKISGDFGIQGRKITADADLEGTKYTADQHRIGVEAAAGLRDSDLSSAIKAHPEWKLDDIEQARKKLKPGNNQPPPLPDLNAASTTNPAPTNPVRNGLDAAASNTNIFEPVKKPILDDLLSPSAPVKTAFPEPSAPEEQEKLSAFGKRGLGLLRTNKEINNALPTQQKSFESAKKANDFFLSPEEQEKRRKRAGIQ